MLIAGNQLSHVPEFLQVDALTVGAGLARDEVLKSST